MQILCEKARVLGCAKRFAEAEVQAQHALDLYPGFVTLATSVSSSSDDSVSLESVTRFFTGALVQSYVRLVSAQMTQPHQKSALLQLCRCGLDAASANPG